MLHPGGINHNNVEASVYKVFYLEAVLEILNINPNYSHIRFERHFDNTRVESKNNVIENVNRLKNPFNDI